MKNFFVLIILFSTLTVHSEMLSCEHFQNNDSIENTRKLLKTYTFEYWAVATKQITNLAAPLQKKGFVVGDFHFNNIGIYYDYTKNKTELVINDFDDAGYNYLIIDLLKYITFVKKTNKLVDLDMLIGHYVSGLQLKPLDAPAEIQTLLNSNQLVFMKSYSKYIDNRKFEFENFNPATLTSSQKNRITDFMQLKLIKQLSDIEYMLKISDSGSSIGMERYEFIGTHQNGARGIVEFKKLKCSATGSLKMQDPIANFDYVKKFYLNNFSASMVSNQHIYRQTDNNYFLVRQKVNNPLKKLEIEKMTADKLQMYTNYFAHYLGAIHSKSANGDYAESVQNNKVELLKTAKLISKIFKDEVND